MEDNIIEIGSEPSWNDVTPVWIRTQMQDFGIRTKTELARRAGVNISSLTEGMSESNPRPISETMKPTLWHFFNGLALERAIAEFNK